MKRCTVCGEIVADDVEVCPVCKAKTFAPVEEKAKFACEHVVGDGVCDDKEIMDGLHAHFTGECTEVGMYLAMSRVAEREGYPEVAEAFKRYAYESPFSRATASARSAAGTDKPSWAWPPPMCVWTVAAAVAPDAACARLNRRPGPRAKASPAFLHQPALAGFF